MKKKLLPALLALILAAAMLSGTAFAVDGPDYQTALIAQLEAGVRPSANNLFLGLNQWKSMEDGPEKSMLAMRYAAIKKLDLSDMGLTQKGSGSGAADDLAMLEPFLGLEELDLSSREDTPSDSRNTLSNLDHLMNLPNLRRLDASGNQLEAKSGMTGGVSGLAYSVRLEALDLSGNKKLGSSGSVKDALAPLAWLTNLRELNLSDTAFSDSDVQYIQSMMSLGTLDLSGTPVKNLDLSGLTWLTSLTAKNLTLDSLKLPRNLQTADLTGTRLRVKSENEDDAVAAMQTYGDSGLQLVNGSGSSQTVYTVTVADTVNGTVELSARTAAQGAKVTISVTPYEGYAQDSVSVSYENGEGALTRVPVTNGAFTMPAGNVTVTVRFMRQNVAFQYNDPGKGSVSFDKEQPARGERVNFVADLEKGYQIRQITGKIGNKTVPVYRNTNGTYCFDMPRLKENEALVFTVTIVETVTARYSGSGQFGGQLTLSGLLPGQQYVCQMSETGSSGACTIVTFTAQDTSTQLEVRRSTGGYLVSLWKYDPWAASVRDLTNVFYEVTAR